MNGPSTAYFCPRCHSPAVEYPQLVTGGTSPAACNACGWKGKKSELATSVFQHDMGSSEQVQQQFVDDFRKLLAKDVALPIARFLSKWGFMFGDNKQQAKLLTRYITAMAKGAVKGLLEERVTFEKERINAS